MLSCSLALTSTSRLYRNKTIKVLLNEDTDLFGPALNSALEVRNPASEIIKRRVRVLDREEHAGVKSLGRQ
jgi:hypothetical protein